jgi:hypothetical protein
MGAPRDKKEVLFSKKNQKTLFLELRTRSGTAEAALPFEAPLGSM